MPYLEREVGDLVSENYARAAVFAEHGIDFCCGGDRTLAEACSASAAEPQVVVTALAALENTAGKASDDPRSWTSRRLVNQIQDVHHEYVRKTAPILGQWTQKIARVHGESHPELHELVQVFAELADELHRHMEEEEGEIFPLFVALEKALSGDDAVGEAVPAELVESLEHDHDEAGRLMRRIRELSDNYTVPADGCTTYRATFELMHEFEGDLYHHVHLENNVLFPRAREVSASN